MRIFKALTLGLLIVAGSSLLYAQSSTVPWSSFGGGYATAFMGNTRVTSMVVQGFTGASSSANSGIRSGFLVYPFRAPLSTGIQANGEKGLPATYELMQNYPNPFNPATTIQFALPRASSVRLEVYNVLGQEVALLADEVRPAGYHTVVWNGRNRNGTSVSSGVYIFRLTAQDISGTSSFSQLKKMILLK